MIVSSLRSDGSVRCVLRFGDAVEAVSRTKQQFKDECDINKILKRYKKTGVVPSNGKPAIYGDFTGVLDYQSMMNKVAHANEVFEQLPIDVRKEMGFDPANMVAFALDDKNYEKAVQLGLRVKDDVKEKAKADAMVAKSVADQAKLDKEFADRVKKAMAAPAA